MPGVGPWPGGHVARWARSWGGHVAGVERSRGGQKQLK